MSPVCDCATLVALRHMGVSGERASLDAECLHWSAYKMTTDINAEMVAKLGLDTLTRLAGAHVWWKTAAEVLADPQQLVPRVMECGDWDDVMLLENTFGDRLFRRAIEEAEAGQFSARSWHFWHYRLALAEVEQVPPMPARWISEHEAASFTGKGSQILD